ncbi:hypothetical protein MTO96_012778 [Rhipicephalus appendiculatus]
MVPAGLATSSTASLGMTPSRFALWDQQQRLPFHRALLETDRMQAFYGCSVLAPPTCHRSSGFVTNGYATAKACSAQSGLPSSARSIAGNDAMADPGENRTQQHSDDHHVLLQGLRLRPQRHHLLFM